MLKYMETLGFRGRDKVTGFEGVITSISFDLYGCVQLLLNPGIKDGKLSDCCWFDAARVELKKKDVRVMEPPSFETRKEKGPEMKPTNLRRN
jgi:hypothetical protein